MTTTNRFLTGTFALTLALTPLFLTQPAHALGFDSLKKLTEAFVGKCPGGQRLNLFLIDLFNLDPAHTVSKMGADGQQHCKHNAFGVNEFTRRALALAIPMGAIYIGDTLLRSRGMITTSTDEKGKDITELSKNVQKIVYGLLFLGSVGSAIESKCKNNGFLNMDTKSLLSVLGVIATTSKLFELVFDFKTPKVSCDVCNEATQS